MNKGLEVLMEHWKITEHLDAAVTAMRQATIGDYNERLEKITSAIRHINDAKAELPEVDKVVVLQ